MSMVDTMIIRDEINRALATMQVTLPVPRSKSGFKNYYKSGFKENRLNGQTTPSDNTDEKVIITEKPAILHDVICYYYFYSRMNSKDNTSSGIIHNSNKKLIMFNGDDEIISFDHNNDVGSGIYANQSGTTSKQIQTFDNMIYKTKKFSDFYYDDLFLSNNGRGVTLPGDEISESTKDGRILLPLSLITTGSSLQEGITGWNASFSGAATIFNYLVKNNTPISTLMDLKSKSYINWGSVSGSNYNKGCVYGINNIIPNEGLLFDKGIKYTLNAQMLNKVYSDNILEYWAFAVIYVNYEEIE